MPAARTLLSQFQPTPHTDARLPVKLPQPRKIPSTIYVDEITKSEWQRDQVAHALCNNRAISESVRESLEIPHVLGIFYHGYKPTAELAIRSLGPFVPSALVFCRSVVFGKRRAEKGRTGQIVPSDGRCSFLPQICEPLQTECGDRGSTEVQFFVAGDRISKRVCL